jgi:hypothetical protein
MKKIQNGKINKNIFVSVSLLLLAIITATTLASPFIDTPIFLPIIFMEEIPTQTTTPTPEPVPDEWLVYLNLIREQGMLPEVSENTEWSDGCWLHSRYMVKNDVIQHSEDPGNPWYSSEGDQAAQNSNIMVSSNDQATDQFAIDLWMTGPFHGIGILDPALLQVGFGSYREEIGTYNMGASLDVLRGLGSLPSSVQFPLMWPGDNTTIQYTTYSGFESPDPLTSCPGYSAPSGPPIYLQIGPGNLTPNVSAHELLANGSTIDHCVFDETNYFNPDGSWQNLGRQILDARDAIIIMPKVPLSPGTTYSVSITNAANIYTWTFTVSSEVKHEINSEIQIIE